MRASSLLITMLLLAFAVTTASAAPATLKLGTVAPKDSSIERILEEMGIRWRASGVDLRIYAGGAKGGEAEMVRQMRNGVLDSALLTANGLAEIDRSVESLQDIPMIFRSLDEVDYVGNALRPRMEKRLRDKGFVVLFWVDAGWVRFFSKNPITHPDDLRKAKLFAWSGDVVAVDILKSNGFHPQVLETNDILPSLQTGMIDAVAMPPYFALTTQMYTRAPNVLMLDWAPLVGALVVTERSWNRLPPDVQRALAAAAAPAGQHMKDRNRKDAEDAIAAMQKRKLNVVQPTPAIIAEWRATAEKSYPALRQKKIGAETFDEIVELLRKYRSVPQATGGRK